jgi:hypothetical protein
MDNRMTIEDRLREIRERISRAIAEGEQEIADEIYHTEFLPAEEASEKIWECR